MCRQRLDGRTGGERAGFRTQSPGRQDGIALGGGWRQNDPRGAGRGAPHSELGTEAGRRKRSQGAMRASGGDPLAVRGKSELRNSEQRTQSRDGFRVRLWRRWENAPGASLQVTILSRRPTAPPHTQPALLFVSQSGRNRLLLAAGGWLPVWLMPVSSPDSANQRAAVFFWGRNKGAGIKGAEEGGRADTHQLGELDPEAGPELECWGRGRRR